MRASHRAIARTSRWPPCLPGLAEASGTVRWPPPTSCRSAADGEALFRFAPRCQGNRGRFGRFPCCPQHRSVPWFRGPPWPGRIPLLRCFERAMKIELVRTFERVHALRSELRVLLAGGRPAPIFRTVILQLSQQPSQLWESWKRHRRFQSGRSPRLFHSLLGVQTLPASDSSSCCVAVVRCSHGARWRSSFWRQTDFETN